jgi:hypothetical protein
MQSIYTGVLDWNADQFRAAAAAVGEEARITHVVMVDTDVHTWDRGVHGAAWLAWESRLVQLTQMAAHYGLKALEEDEASSMDIYAVPGAKVVFSHPGAGHSFDRENAAKYLTVGATYTVRSTEVDESRTEVVLQEVPFVRFNSVSFSDAREGR